MLYEPIFLLFLYFLRGGSSEPGLGELALVAELADTHGGLAKFFNLC